MRGELEVVFGSVGCLNIEAVLNLERHLHVSDPGLCEQVVLGNDLSMGHENVFSNQVHTGKDVGVQKLGVKFSFIKIEEFVINWLSLSNRESRMFRNVNLEKLFCCVRLEEKNLIIISYFINVFDKSDTIIVNVNINAMV